MMLRTQDDVDTAPAGTVVRTENGGSWRKLPDSRGWWNKADQVLGHTFRLPATVLSD